MALFSDEKKPLVGKHIKGITCDVKNCVYHDGDAYCTADRIAVMYAGQLVEQGSVYEIFAQPAHPYTEKLMQALPRQSKEEGRLETIEGTVPRLTHVEPGCRFANRCPYAADICRTQDPPAVHAGGTHYYTCHVRKEDR